MVQPSTFPIGGSGVKDLQRRFRVFLVAPEWPSMDWYEPLEKIAVNEVYYWKGTPVFRERNGPMRMGIPWGLWAMLVDSTTPKVRSPTYPEHPKKKNTHDQTK